MSAMRGLKFPENALEDRLDFLNVITVSGTDLIRADGNIAAYNDLSDWHLRLRLKQARDATANASASIDAYEAVLDKLFEHRSLSQ